MFISFTTISYFSDTNTIKFLSSFPVKAWGPSYSSTCYPLCEAHILQDIRICNELRNYYVIVPNTLMRILWPWESCIHMHASIPKLSYPRTRPQSTNTNARYEFDIQEGNLGNRTHLSDGSSFRFNACTDSIPILIVVNIITTTGTPSVHNCSARPCVFHVSVICLVEVTLLGNWL